MTTYRGGRGWLRYSERSTGRPNRGNGEWRNGQEEGGPKVVAAWLTLPCYMKEDLQLMGERARVVGSRGLLYSVQATEAADAMGGVLAECCGDYPEVRDMSVTTMVAELEGRDYIVQAFVAPEGSPELLDSVAEDVVAQTNEILERSLLPFRLPPINGGQ